MDEFDLLARECGALNLRDIGEGLRSARFADESLAFLWEGSQQTVAATGGLIPACGTSDAETFVDALVASGNFHRMKVPEMVREPVAVL